MTERVRYGIVPAYCAHALLVIGGVGTICSAVGSLHWFLELSMHFQVQYAVILSAAAILYIACKRMGFALIAMVVAFPALIQLDLWASATAAVPGATGGQIRVAAHNAEQPNHEVAPAQEFFSVHDYDIVGISELSNAWQAALAPALKKYPYRLELPRDDYFGLGLYSKLPLQFSAVRLDAHDLPVIRAELNSENRRFEFWFVHLDAPIRAKNTAWRNQELTELANTWKHSPNRVIAFGDFNTSTYTPVFREFLQLSGMRNPQAQYGVRFSWPSFFPWLYTTIDHVLVKGDVQVADLRSGPNLKSDHLPLLFTIE